MLINKTCRPIHIYGRLHLTFYDADNAAKVALMDGETSNFLIIPRSSNDDQGERFGEPGFNPSSLTEIFKFDEMINQIERKYPSQKLLICAGRSQFLQARTSFLVGCHLILSYRTELEETYRAFERLHGIFEQVSSAKCGGLSVRSCLSSVYAAKKWELIDFRERFNALPTMSHSIQIDEYMHYARWLCFLCKANDA
jgi:hypothetical protein